jgi:Capsule assembly protein Wzi
MSAAAFALSGSAAAQPGSSDFAAANALAAEKAPPEALSLLSETRRDIERLVVGGHLPLEALTFSPVDRGEVAAWLRADHNSGTTSVSYRRLKDQLSWDASRWYESSNSDQPMPAPATFALYGDQSAQLLIAPFIRFQPVIDDGEFLWTESSRLGFRGKLYAGRKVVISSGLYLAEIDDGRRFSDPLVAGTDMILHESEATISARLGPVRLRMGRDRHQWGAGVSGSLLFSSSAQPFNFMEYQLRLGDTFRFLALTGVTSLHQNRYLALHRVSWTPTPRLSIGFSEGARYQANGLHPLYVSGIVPYTLVERFDLQDNMNDPERETQRNNVLWSIDGVLRFSDHGLVYAELLADDIATETAEMPTRGGIQTGLTLTPNWLGWDWTIGAEYTRVSNFTYSVYYQDLCLCNWEHQDKPLGFPYGPDVEMMLGRLAVSPDRFWTGRLWLRHQRKGGGNIGAAWVPVEEGCDPCEVYCGDTSAWSFDGKPYREFTAGCAVDYDPLIFLRLSLWMETVWHEDGQTVSNTKSSPFARFGCAFGWGGY